MWHPTKASLYKSRPKNVLVSSDKEENTGTKMFTSFPTVQEFEEFQLKQEIAHLYEIIPDKHYTPVYVFFDMDRRFDNYIIDDTYYHVVINTFKEVFEKFMKDIYNLDIKLIEGHTFQAAYAPSPSKFSAHVKINIKVHSLEVVENIAINLDKYMHSNSYITETQREMFYYRKSQDRLVPIIDKSVYSNFRSFRTLYSSKFKTNAPKKIPFGKSSKHILDHLVRYYPENPQSCIDVHITEKNIDVAMTSNIDEEGFLPHLPMKEAKPSIDNSCVFIKAEFNQYIQQMIVSSPVITTMLKQTNIRFDEVKALSPTIYRFILSSSCKCYCPYGERIHNSNRSMFDYNCLTGILTYRCFDEECSCVRDLKNFNKYSNKQHFSAICILQNVDTLHCKTAMINWNEIYNLETMKEYPLEKLVCIRGNMGSAKTTILVNEFMPRYCANENTKCLFITYQILLSRKYSAMLQQLGFQSYLDMDEANITANKVIVCLDSLWRVQTTNFDFIFIDETLSVLLHFNSPLMKHVSKVSASLEFLLYQAKYIYLLDACIDNTMTFNFVKYLCERKNIQAHWILNNYIRPSNRKCDILYNKDKRLDNLMRMKAVDAICAILGNDGKVVVSSSTKSFTAQLESELKTRFGETKTYMVYNSDTSKSIMMEHGAKPNATWIQYDVVIYSPSISAGISFEALHFDELVCYVENSLFTPGVDLVIQQMFRVRQLKTGMMKVFMNDLEVSNESAYPIHEDVLDEYLEKNLSDVNYDSQVIVTDKGVRYDTDRISYQILKGILLNRNKSVLKFYDILVNTLQKDYNIHCTTQKLQEDKKDLERAIEMYEKWKKETAQQVEFSSYLIINNMAYLEICNKLKRNQDVTPEEKLKKWIYDMSKNVWRISGEVDEYFFRNYIGEVTVKNIKNKFEVYYKMMRLEHLLFMSLEENKRNYYEKLQDILTDDYNIKLYRTKVKEFHKKLEIGQEVCDKVFEEGYKNKLLAGETITFTSTSLCDNIKVFLQGKSDSEFDAIRRILSLKKETYSERKKVFEDKKLILALFRNIMSIVFDINVKTLSRGNKNKNRANYNNVVYGIEIKSKQEMVMKYKLNVRLIEENERQEEEDELERKM
jgi:hypothetical protein